MSATIIAFVLAIVSAYLLATVIVLYKENKNISLKAQTFGLHFTAYVERLYRAAAKTLNTSRAWGFKFSSIEDTEFIQLVRKHGHEGLIFFVPMRPRRSVLGILSYTSSSDEHQSVPCIIENDEQTRFEDGHKVRFRSIFPMFGTERMYISTVETWLRDGTIRVCKDIKAKDEMDKIRACWGDATMALIRIPERSVIKRTLEQSNSEDAVYDLLMRSVVDEPKHMERMLFTNNPLRTDNGLIELGGNYKISHTDALDRLDAISTAVTEWINMSTAEPVDIRTLKLIERIGKLAETFRRDEGEEDLEKMDCVGRILEALKDEGEAGLIFALSAFGMFGTDITKITGYGRNKISRALTKTVAANEQYAWIKELYDSHSVNGFKAGRKYNDEDVDNFSRIFGFFAGIDESKFSFAYTDEQLAHRRA
jgi:hypothetical protein